MIITYLRSSSYNTWDWCPHKYFLSYVLGIPEDSNKSAEKGSIVHKVLEIRAKHKLALDNNKDSVSDNDIGEFSIQQCEDIDIVLNQVYEYYVSRSIHNYTKQDYGDCLDWTNKVIGSDFDPIKKDIICPELYFDFEIKKPWAKYDFDIDGENLTGYLALKGTIDLVIKLSDNVYEILDWKTGRRWDWSKDKEKTLDNLVKDPQLRMYHYAVHNKFPDIDDFMMTVYYINGGGPYTVCFSKDDIKDTEQMLKQRFLQIKKNVKPGLNVTWKCSKLCHYGKNCFGGKETICQEIKGSLENDGMSKTLGKYCNKKVLGKYVEGGGRKHELDGKEIS